jgi:TolB-like protein/Tfp pilus assembly protein PilF
MAAIWSDAIVTDDSLAQAVRALRRSLGPDAMRLRNVPRRGYMLTASAVVQSNELRTASQPPRLALLPFSLTPPNLSLRLALDGLIEDLAARLARFKEISIVSNHSTLVAFDRTGDARQASEFLGASQFLDGNAQAHGEEIVLSVRLNDVAGDRQIWGETIRVDPKSTDETIARVARAIITWMELDLDRQAAGPINEPGFLAPANTLLRYGLLHLRSYEPGNNEEARNLFRNALKIEGEYALAHAYLAMAELAIVNFLDCPPEAMDHAFAAVRLAPDDSRCHRALGLAYMGAGDAAGAEAALRHGLDLNASDADTMSILGYVLTCRGFARDAMRWFEKAFFLNPLPPDWYRQDYSIALMALDRYEEARAELSRHPRLKHFGEMRLAACLAALGDVVGSAGHLDAARSKAGTQDLLALIDGTHDYGSPATKAHFRKQVAYAIALTKG